MRSFITRAGKPVGKVPFSDIISELMGRLLTLQKVVRSVVENTKTHKYDVHQKKIAAIIEHIHGKMSCSACETPPNPRRPGK